MKRILLILLPAFFMIESVLGQELLVKGILQDERAQPVGVANVILHKAVDSAEIAAALSNEDGSFELSAPEGSYFLEFNLLGENRQFMKLAAANGTIDLGTVVFKIQRSQLEEAVIVGERNPMSLQIDKRVFNIASDLNTQGANATEALQNIPSVTVDAEGNVSLRGSESVRILIDGKASGFASSADALQQLQADMIDRIEVITNASARYEAQGQSGIINIILKKNSRAGFNGSVTLRGGYYPDNGIGLNANYRKGKVNVFGALTLNYREVAGRSETRQQLQNEDTSFLYFQHYRHTRRKWGTNANVGINYFLNDKNTVNATFGIRSGNGRNTMDRGYENYTIDHAFVSENIRIEEAKELEDMLEGAVAYTYRFGKQDGEWKTEIRAYHDQDFERSGYSETSTAFTDILNEKSKADITEKSVMLQSDLVIPFSEKGKVETGIRGQIRDFYNDFGYDQLLNGDWVSPAQFNDQFNYNEKVYAAYVMASNNFGRLGIQAGLRGEYSDIFTRQHSLSEDGDTRNYLNMFPSVAFSYKQSDNHTFQLSYSRRIRRPGQWDLMPFMKFGDNREMRIGNPYMAPELTGSYEAGMLNSFENGSLLSSVYYRHTKNKFENIAFLGDDGIIYRQMMNISTGDAVGLELNVNYNPFTWGRVTSGFNFFREVIRGNYNGESFDMSNFSWTNRTSMNLTLPDKWRFQISGNYEAPRVTPQGKRLSQYFMDFGFSKDLLKNKATLGVNVTDIFNSRKWRNVTSTPEIQSESWFQWRQRSIRLTLTYRFNQQKKEPENIIESGAGES